MLEEKDMLEQTAQEDEAPQVEETTQAADAAEEQDGSEATVEIVLEEKAGPEPEEPTGFEAPSPRIIETNTAAPATGGSASIKDFAAPNLDLVMNVPMQLSVEIGRAKKTLREILELGKESLVILDKAAGDTVDLYVNGSFVAKGEVVVVNEHFGVRITEIIANSEMLNTL